MASSKNLEIFNFDENLFGELLNILNLLRNNFGVFCLNSLKLVLAKISSVKVHSFYESLYTVFPQLNAAAFIKFS